MRQILPSVNTSAIIMATRTINKAKGGRYEITRKSESSHYMGNWLVSTHYNYLNDHLWHVISIGGTQKLLPNNTLQRRRMYANQK